MIDSAPGYLHVPRVLRKSQLSSAESHLLWECAREAIAARARPAIGATCCASSANWRTGWRMADAPRRRLRVAAAVVFDGPDLLMTQRPPGGALGLQWEFPGGKLERGETPEVALVREIREELGVAALAHKRPWA